MLGSFSGVGPEVVVALGLRQARRDFSAMEEVAHDPVGDRPIIAVHAMMVRTQAGFAGELKATRCAKAHAPHRSERHANPPGSAGRNKFVPLPARVPVVKSRSAREIRLRGAYAFVAVGRI